MKPPFYLSDLKDCKTHFIVQAWICFNAVVPPLVLVQSLLLARTPTTELFCESSFAFPFPEKHFPFNFQNAAMYCSMYEWFVHWKSSRKEWSLSPCLITTLCDERHSAKASWSERNYFPTHRTINRKLLRLPRNRAARVPRNAKQLNPGGEYSTVQSTRPNFLGHPLRKVQWECSTPLPNKKCSRVRCQVLDISVRIPYSAAPLNFRD